MEAMGSEQSNQQQLDRKVVQQLNEAKYASLTSRAVSDPARMLIDFLVESVDVREEGREPRKNKRSEKARFALRRAMEGFVGDLLRVYRDEKSGGWVYRSRKANSFSGGEVSYRNFVTVLKTLRGLIETKVGYQEWSNGFDAGGPRLPIRTKATRFRANSEMMGFCEDFGVNVSEIADHFIRELPRYPLVKKAGSVRDLHGVKVRGQVMRFERIGKAKELEQQVRDLNEFLDRFDLRGGSHRGYIRVFNQGDHPSFDWNKGGRMYSQGDDSYQRLSQDERLRMTVDGEPVCEIDIRASYLTIYHAHHDVPLDAERDPYELPGFPAEARGVIKLWFVATFGNNGHLDRWPREIAKKYKEEHGRPIGKRYPVKRIREKALKLYPLLEKWGTEDFGWPDLMFIESQAMIGAMSELMSLGIPSLSVHDSLIVPAVEQEIAEQKHYLKETGIVPVLKVNWSLPSEPFGSGKTEDENIDDWDSPAETCKRTDDPFGSGKTEDENIDDWDSPAERDHDNKNTAAGADDDAADGSYF